MVLNNSLKDHYLLLKLLIKILITKVKDLQFLYDMCLDYENITPQKSNNHILPNMNS
jgi:hypothetical protein